MASVLPLAWYAPWFSGLVLFGEWVYAKIARFVKKYYAAFCLKFLLSLLGTGLSLAQLTIGGK